MEVVSGQQVTEVAGKRTCLGQFNPAAHRHVLFAFLQLFLLVEAVLVERGVLDRRFVGEVVAQLLEPSHSSGHVAANVLRRGVLFEVDAGIQACIGVGHVCEVVAEVVHIVSVAHTGASAAHGPLLFFRLFGDDQLVLVLRALEHTLEFERLSELGWTEWPMSICTLFLHAITGY